jgi:hypothetical protein
MSAKRASKERRWGKSALANIGIQAATAAPSRGPSEQQLDRLKEQLLAPILSSIQSSALAAELRWVANEAAALAWLTVCPLLVLPTLFEEKVRRALARWEHQQVIWHARRDRARA